MSEKPAVPLAARAAYHHADDLHALRLWAQAYAIQAGLTAARADLLVLAVSELASNTLLYTSGGGLVEMRAEDGGVVCEVTDGGPMSARTARAMPPADAPSGRGLAIVKQVCDDVMVRAEGAHHRAVVGEIRLDRFVGGIDRQIGRQDANRQDTGVVEGAGLADHL